MNIGVCGLNDKRLFIAALSALLGESGTTMLLSRNELLLTLSSEYSSEFRIGKASAAIVIGELTEFIHMLADDNQFLVVDIYAEIPETIDVFVFVSDRDYYVKAIQDAGYFLDATVIISLMNVKKFNSLNSEVVADTIKPSVILQNLEGVLACRTITYESVKPWEKALVSIIGASLPGEQSSVSESRIRNLSARF